MPWLQSCHSLCFKICLTSCHRSGPSLWPLSYYCFSVSISATASHSFSVLSLSHELNPTHWLRLCGCCQLSLCDSVPVSAPYSCHISSLDSALVSALNPAPVSYPVLSICPQFYLCLDPISAPDLTPYTSSKDSVPSPYHHQYCPGICVPCCFPSWAMH